MEKQAVPCCSSFAWVAQLVEHSPEEGRVPGSTPGPSTEVERSETKVRKTKRPNGRFVFGPGVRKGETGLGSRRKAGAAWLRGRVAQIFSGKLCVTGKTCCFPVEEGFGKPRATSRQLAAGGSTLVVFPSASCPSTERVEGVIEKENPPPKRRVHPLERREDRHTTEDPVDNAALFEVRVTCNTG